MTRSVHIFGDKRIVITTKIVKVSIEGQRPYNRIQASASNQGIFATRDTANDAIEAVLDRFKRREFPDRELPPPSSDI